MDRSLPGGQVRSSLALGGPDFEEPATHRRVGVGYEFEAGLAQSEVLAALDAADVGLALFDADDRLVYCNGVYADLIPSVPRGSLIRRRYEVLLEAWIAELELSDREARTRFRRERLLSREAARVCFDVRTTRGRSLHVTERRTSEGGSLTTIEDRKENARQLAEQSCARRSAENANAAKTQFPCAMSHELRTPLNAMLGFTQRLQRDTKQPLPERHRMRVDQVMKAGEHLLRLIDDLLDLSRIEAEQPAISAEPVSVTDVLQHVLTTLGPSAAAAGIDVALAPPPAGGVPNIAADP